MAKSVMPKSKAKTAYGLLSEIRKLIIEEPKRYDQTSWKSAVSAIPQSLAPACGTVCCVAGWVDTLKSKRPLRASDADQVVIVDGQYEMSYAHRARTILGLTPDQGERLFDSSAAGERLRFDDSTLQSVPILKTHAKRGAAHIAKFQKKYATQLKAKRV